MEEEVVNVAHRLYEILRRIKEYEGTNAYSILGEIFDIEEEERAEIILAYGGIFSLIEETKENLNNIKGIQKKKYLLALSEVTEALTRISFEVEGHIGDYKRNISIIALERIDACGDLLNQGMEEFKVSKEVLEEFLRDIDCLISRVHESIMSDTLKVVLLDNLHKIKDSILNYQLRGSRGIKNALDSSIGAMMLSTEGPKTEEEKNIFKSIFELIGHFNEMVTFGKSVTIGIAPIINHFLENR